MNDFFEAIGASGVGQYMAGNPAAFPTVETIHVLAITTVIGLIAIVDLRLIGVASSGYPVTRLTRALLPATWTAFVIAVVTGTLLFSSQPVTYVDNTAFRMKMLLIAAAGINMLVFHRVTMRDIAIWDREGPIPVPVRLAGGISLLLWIFVVACGRWIGFTTAPF